MHMARAIKVFSINTMPVWGWFSPAVKYRYSNISSARDSGTSNVAISRSKQHVDHLFFCRNVHNENIQIA